VKIVPVAKRSEAARKRAFRIREGDKLRAVDRERKRQSRAAAIPEFIGVDSEGIGRGKNHRVLLLGVGEAQYIARDLKRGLHWQEVFSFLYSQYKAHPKAAFVGFYLGYDFNRWLATLPKQAAMMLLTTAGKAMRRRKDGKARQFFPVRCEGWELDMLGFKRLSIRPWCGCIPEAGKKCEHEPAPWMHICDAGPFFQMPFKNVINPDMWKNDPEGPVCSRKEWLSICADKDRRATAKLDARMMKYNRLENTLLAKVMTRLAKGFKSVGISLGRDQWYGPGASASVWLQQNNAPKKMQLASLGIPDWFTDVCMWSYFGGWFEIFSHGLIRGESWNYDINNAYPYATCQLPHICGDCQCARGNGEYKGSGKYVLVYATVFTKGSRIGAVPYRDKAGAILRPNIAKGWYWRHELLSAQRAGIVGKVFYYEWAEFIPCEHDNPFRDIRRLYDLRLSVGKSSAIGLAIKLINNSLYGKFAQSVGSAPFGNWFYSSYITSHCRTQILDAIASHPGGTDSVLMVATDGVCFDSSHPSLPISTALGEWEETKYTDLCLFKPGVYWHREGKERLAKIKSRGVPKESFKQQLTLMESMFTDFLRVGSHPESSFAKEILTDRYGEYYAEFTVENGWPKFAAEVGFRMRSCKQALNEGNWEGAGEVQEKALIWQSSDPQSKRRKPFYNDAKRRIDTVIHELPFGDKETSYYHMPVTQPDIGYDFDGNALHPIMDAMNALTGADEEWETVWDSIR
jgi:DNA polymerase type B, organellar and viral